MLRLLICDDAPEAREAVKVSLAEQPEIEDRTVELKPRQAFTVPKGVLHRPVVPERSAVLMIETAGVVATGD